MSVSSENARQKTPRSPFLVFPGEFLNAVGIELLLLKFLRSGGVFSLTNKPHKLLWGFASQLLKTCDTIFCKLNRVTPRFGLGLSQCSRAGSARFVLSSRMPCTVTTRKTPLNQLLATRHQPVLDPCPKTRRLQCFPQLTFSLFSVGTFCSFPFSSRLAASQLREQ